MTSDQDFYQTSFDRQRQASFSSHLEAESDRLADIGLGLISSTALGNATRNRWTLGDPDTIFVAIKSHLELHLGRSSGLGAFYDQLRVGGRGLS